MEKVHEIKNSPNQPLSIENDLNIKIFPSVGSNKLFVEGNFSGKPHFLIYDENGNKIMNYESYYLNTKFYFFLAYLMNKNIF